jgi:Pectinacetylesterase
MTTPVPTVPQRAPGFASIAPPLGAPLLPAEAATLTPPAPAGWSYFPIEGAVCRDGSPAGIYVHGTDSDKLYIYLEGGGACFNDHFCAFNPKNVNEVLAGDGDSVIGSAAGAVPGRQQPGAYSNGPNGIFDSANPKNPFKDWNGVYIPYCTGDVFAGNRANVMIPNIATPQQFVGHLNMKKFIARIVPTFRAKVNQVVLTGSSAGGFATAMNVSLVQDSFDPVPVIGIDDSGPPFEDEHLPVCMQKRWREAWGLDDSFPPDCTECRQADGGGLVRFADFLLKKHPSMRLALLSSAEDEVMRLFYSAGLNDCKGYDEADPVAITVGQFTPGTYFPAADYTKGVASLIERYRSTGRFASYLMSGQRHQHLFRSRLYEAPAGSSLPVLADFIAKFVAGKVENVGP